MTTPDTAALVEQVRYGISVVLGWERERHGLPSARGSLAALATLVERLEAAEATAQRMNEMQFTANAKVTELREALREIAEDYHCIVVEPDPDAGQHLDGCVGCFASAALSEPPCYCAETSTRNCPRHAA